MNPKGKVSCTRYLTRAEPRLGTTTPIAPPTPRRGEGETFPASFGILPLATLSVREIL